MPEDGWLASDGSFRHRMDGGYVSDGSNRRRIVKKYISVDISGTLTRKLIYDATRAKAFPQDSLSATATSVVNDTQQFTATGIATLAGTGGTGGFTLNDTREHPPDAPANVTASTIDHDSIQVTWDDIATNEDNYRVQMKNVDIGGSYSTVATPAANSTSHTENGLNSDTTYQFRVRAENTGGNSIRLQQMLTYRLHQQASARLSRLLAIGKLQFLGIAWRMQTIIRWSTDTMLAEPLAHGRRSRAVLQAHLS